MNLELPKGWIKRPYPWIKPPDPSINGHKVIVCGTRSFRHADLFLKKMDRFAYWLEPMEVVVGGDGHRFEEDGNWTWTGADYYANCWCSINWIIRHIFRPDWEHYGNKAGPVRNTMMVDFLYHRALNKNSHCIAFHDGKSKGTLDCIRKFSAKFGEKNLKVIQYKGK